jgi:hypothetical protein
MEDHKLIYPIGDLKIKINMAKIAKGGSLVGVKNFSVLVEVGH